MNSRQSLHGGYSFRFSPLSRSLPFTPGSHDSGLLLSAAYAITIAPLTG
jgi:hypothetical protein